MARTARRTTLAVLAMTSLLVGVLTACSSAEEPGGPASPTPTSTATATQSSPSPSPTPSAEANSDKPERPAAMDKRDAEGAAAAAEYFLSLRSYIMKTGDTAEWEAMSHRSCGYCKSGLRQARQRAEREDDFDGGEIAAKVFQTYERDALTGIWPFDLNVQEAAITVKDSSGEEVFTSAKSTYSSRVEVGLLDSDWVIVEVADIPED